MAGRVTDSSGKRLPQKESADERQRALLKSAVGRLAPQRKGVTDLYTIGVAGWADEDVFIKELDGAIASLTKVLPIDGRVMLVTALLALTIGVCAGLVPAMQLFRSGLTAPALRATRGRTM